MNPRVLVQQHVNGGRLLISMVLLAATAVAQDEPHLWSRTYGAVTLQPSGLILDTKLEARVPILRLGGLVFNSTFIGGGARVAASPAHVELAARASVMPIDVLPITFEAVYTSYWESPFGVLPMDSVSGQRSVDRRPLYRADRDFAAYSLALSINPQLQVKVGKVAAFTNLMHTWLRIRPDNHPEPWIFDPLRGMVLAPDDRIFEHTTAVLYDPFSGDGTPLLRVGPALRGRSAAKTTDVTLVAGGLLQWRPGKKPTSPELTLLVAPYLRDPDYLGVIPYIAGVVTVSRLVPFKKLSASL